MDIPIIRGAGLNAHSPEAIESEKYESGSADEDTRALAGSYEEPWLNALEQFEPGSRQRLENPVRGLLVQRDSVQRRLLRLRLLCGGRCSSLDASSVASTSSV
jgi:hypothetical protein